MNAYKSTTTVIFYFSHLLKNVVHFLFTLIIEYLLFIFNSHIKLNFDGLNTTLIKLIYSYFLKYYIFWLNRFFWDILLCEFIYLYCIILISSYIHTLPHKDYYWFGLYFYIYIGYFNRSLSTDYLYIFKK